MPRNMKLLAVPLSQIHGNAQVRQLVSVPSASPIFRFNVPLKRLIDHRLQVYGPIISGIPNLLSKFSFNVISD